MANIFITGSADGLGLLTAKALVAQGHRVVLHARNEGRAQQTLNQAPGADRILIADLEDMQEVIALASAVNALGHFDAVIHNAGVYRASPETIFNVNTLAPYLLTCLIGRPARLIYLSSDMHLSGHFRVADPEAFDGHVTYSDSKLQVLMLCKAIARKWTHVYANAVNPGWVPTKMGGAGAPDSLEGGYETQVWLAGSDDNGAKVSGQYFFHRQPARYNSVADDPGLQEQLLQLCAARSGISLSA